MSKVVSKHGERFLDAPAILELLLERPGAVVSRERILNAVWGVNADPLTNIVEVYIGRLRKRLAGGPQIRTERGLGYMLEQM